MFYQSFSPNHDGRDFAIGDLHGMYDLLFQELAKVSFDFDKDRCFSVGDLIDRGSRSVQCLTLINESWFHAVCGNHEDILRQVARNPSSAAITADWILNGGRWHLMVPTDTMNHYADLVDILPGLLSVELPSGKVVALCHAEYPLPYWAPQDIENNPGLRHKMMWSRSKIQNQETSVVEGIDHILCGHTIVSVPQVLGNTHFIDTGAFYSGQLTLIPLNLLE